MEEVKDNVVDMTGVDCTPVRALNDVIREMKELQALLGQKELEKYIMGLECEAIKNKLHMLNNEGIMSRQHEEKK